MTGNSEWDDDELVGLDDLRPSRRVYGPAAQNPGRNPRQPAKGARSRNSETNPPRRQRPDQGRDVSGNAAPSNRERRPTRSVEPRSQKPVRPESQRSRQAKPRPEPRERFAADRFANDLAAADRKKGASASGWRGTLSKVTGGVVNVGPSGQDRHVNDLQRQLRRPITNGTVAVFSRKGGVGKTTISAYLGLTLASERGGRIVALDGDAEAGSLGWLLAPKAPSTLAALASASPMPTDYAGIRRYTAATPEGLEVIVGDPAEMGPISTTGLEALADQLARHYDLSIFDTGAGVTRATGRVLVNTARTLLLVMSPSVDSVRAAERTLAWLDERPGEAVKENAKVIAVINGIPASTKRGHIERIESHFNERCSAVVRIPWDQHLATGSSQVSLDLLAKPTREAFIELAATTVSSLARRTRGRRELAAAGARHA